MLWVPTLNQVQTSYEFLTNIGAICKFAGYKLWQQPVNFISSSLLIFKLNIFHFNISSSVGVYSDSDGELIFLLQGQQGGVTHVMFSPDGTKLYSGGRKVWNKSELKLKLILATTTALDVIIVIIIV